eukprot:8473972-Karenia_brevis.AAC.1
MAECVYRFIDETTVTPVQMTPPDEKFVSKSQSKFKFESESVITAKKGSDSKKGSSLSSKNLKRTNIWI